VISVSHTYYGIVVKKKMTEMKKNQKYIGLGKNTNIFKKCISVKLF